MKEQHFPLSIPLNNNGTCLPVCSEDCLTVVESEYIPGVNLTTTPLITTPTCQVCVVCGVVVAAVKDCIIHHTGCPPVQWLLTFEGLATTREAQLWFGDAFLDQALATIHGIVRRRPGTDPISVLKRMTS
jgi:hypothetical protein